MMEKGQYNFFIVFSFYCIIVNIYSLVLENFLPYRHNYIYTPQYYESMGVTTREYLTGLRI